MTPEFDIVEGLSSESRVRVNTAPAWRLVDALAVGVGVLMLTESERRLRPLRLNRFTSLNGQA